MWPWLLIQLSSGASAYQPIAIEAMDGALAEPSCTGGAVIAPSASDGTLTDPSITGGQLVID